MLDRILIRETTQDDQMRVGALLSASYSELMCESYEAAVLEAALPLMTHANPALLSSGTYYLSESVDGDVTGCGGWTLKRPGSGEIVPELAHIRHFATHPDWIGKGIGRAIYALCEKKARLAGAGHFECYASLNAEGFYSSLGFKRVKRIVVPMATRVIFPSILMKRAI